MTREIITKIAKAKGINLDYYDHINAYINPNYTKVYITFGTLECCYGHRTFCCQRTVTMLISALQKREEPEWEYTTQGWERIEYIH